MKSGVVSLVSIELAGFKSFAKRTKINFGDGLVAIVGPNGSGKSNIADAIRWVFGEQKNKSLRTDKSEDLIYHGGDSKSRASMAEVIITLDNKSGSIPLDFTEIEITRRLYRSGESNYLLNSKRVSLSYIQELLASSGFGVGSYTVIGQGMIDRLILSSGQERKQLFDEASGIKQYEIKLGQARKRIETTKQNLAQVQDLLSELRPQQEILSSQAAMFDRRKKLLAETLSSKLAYISQTSLSIGKLVTSTNTKLASRKAMLKVLFTEIAKLDKQHSQNQIVKSRQAALKITEKLTSLESERDASDDIISELKLEIQEVNSQINTQNPLIDQIKTEIDNLVASSESHLKTHSILKLKAGKNEKQISALDGKIKYQTKVLDETRLQLSKSQKTEYLRHSLGLIDILQDSMQRGKSYTDLAMVFYKLRRMIKHSIQDDPAELAMKVGRVQNSISGLLGDREVISESQIKEIIILRASEMDFANTTSRIKDLTLQLRGLEKDNKPQGLEKKHTKLLLELARLEAKRDTLIAQLGALRKELIELASNDNEESNNTYYLRHEEMSNNRVRLEAEIDVVKAELVSANESKESIKALYRQWFRSGSKGIKASEDKIDMSTIEKLEAEAGVLNEISPGVLREASKATQRLEFLESQQEDLLGAIGDLDKASTQITAKMQKVFEKSFEKINISFGKNFVKLFGGGQARLELKEQEFGYGVEIIVQLPNKKAQNLSSLSGGEKALASVALLAGILIANPSPFIVLDEVDAALDELNTKKFAELLASISDKSQVLVVTHNHDTMSAASELLGVTTKGDNDSQVVRVKLDSLPVGSIIN